MHIKFALEIPIFSTFHSWNFGKFALWHVFIIIYLIKKRA
jgi:uncharacterized protein YybS (DUF2232 family)